MNKTMMDILACPIDKNHPLELFEIKKRIVLSQRGHYFAQNVLDFIQ